MKLKQALIDQLIEIQGVTHEEWPSRDDGFSTLHYDSKEIGHFYHSHELDLKLVKKLIQQAGLKHPPDSVSHPNRQAGSQYVELRFQSSDDLGRIVELVKRLVSSA